LQKVVAAAELKVAAAVAVLEVAEVTKETLTLHQEDLQLKYLLCLHLYNLLVLEIAAVVGMDHLQELEAEELELQIILNLE
jgi:hypothetical protein